jgi:SAM-dependent methyltransferase
MTDRDRPAGARTRSSAADWDGAYLSGQAPWDVGHPQSVFMRLADAGALRSPVLDAGCGTGEHTIYFATRGLTAVGVDISEVAIETARRKAAERGVAAEFIVHNILDLESLGQEFRTVVDSGAFHVFDHPTHIARYVAGLRAVLEPAGELYLLCFSDAQPGTCGPRRVSEADLRAAFGNGWSIASIEPASFDVNPPIGPAKAWLARIVRLADVPAEVPAEALPPAALALSSAAPASGAPDQVSAGPSSPAPSRRGTRRRR